MPNRPGGLFVVSAQAAVGQQVARSAAAVGRVSGVLGSVGDVTNTLATARPRALVIDLDSPLATAALAAAAPHRTDVMIVLLASTGSFDRAPRGAHAVVDEAALDAVLRQACAPPQSAARAFELLAGVTTLAGDLDVGLRDTATSVARAFGVARCVFAIGEPVDSVDERVHAALASDATVVVIDEKGGLASYAGAAFDDRANGLGCLGLVADGVRLFDDVDRAALSSVAARLGTELAWRTSQSRSGEQIDRAAHSAGLDPLTAVWGRAALVRLTSMYVSTAMRFKTALGLIVMDIVDLHGINARRGHDIGDALLVRVADAARSQTRTEDIVGRYTPGAIVTILQGTSLEGARRAAARIKDQLDERLAGLDVAIAAEVSVRVGVCVAEPNEDAAGLLERATRQARSPEQAARARASSQGEEVGTTLGGTYRLLHEIGQGAMGLVYRAEDLALERAVAIKMLRPDLVEDLEVVEQMRAEASLLARLQHPNLVQVFSFAHGGGDTYIVMELVEGECLLQTVDRHRLDDAVLPVADVLAIAAEIGSALDALHDHGVIHRDVKPANVIRDPFRSRSVLVDVGIARRFGQAVETAGTPGYVAPEVIRGEEATQRSDVYGFAATIYTLLTLSSPWPDEGRVAVLSRQASGEQPAPLSSHRAELAPADAIMASALASTPTLRPQSAGAFVRELSGALSSMVPVEKPVDDGAAKHGITGRLILPRRAQAHQARTRGVVFRSVARAIGVREAERFRDRLDPEDSNLARALADAAPLDWLPTTLFLRLLEVAPEHTGRTGASLAYDIARATVRASFRRFFPASAATLMPERTLSVIRTIWSRYHTWGTLACMPLHAREVVVRVGDTPKVADLCSFASGLFEQMVILSGGLAPHIEHERCEARGDTVCLYRVTWDRSV